MKKIPRTILTDCAFIMVSKDYKSKIFSLEMKGSINELMGKKFIDPDVGQAIADLLLMGHKFFFLNKEFAPLITDSLSDKAKRDLGAFLLNIGEPPEDIDLDTENGIDEILKMLFVSLVEITNKGIAKFLE